jgi:hypothetical protein
MFQFQYHGSTLHRYGVVPEGAVKDADIVAGQQADTEPSCPPLQIYTPDEVRFRARRPLEPLIRKCAGFLLGQFYAGLRAETLLCRGLFGLADGMYPGGVKFRWKCRILPTRGRIKPRVCRGRGSMIQYAAGQADTNDGCCTQQQRNHRYHGK